MLRPRTVPWLVLIVVGLVAFTAGRTAASDAVLYRPMIADPRESLVRMQVSSFTQDFRYGSDITDSTTTGGWDDDVTGVGFDLGAGKIFRAPTWHGAFGWNGPWKRYQLSASAMIAPNFDRIQAMFVTNVDYQFGGALEIQWSGSGDDGTGVTTFDRPVVSTRTGLYHRSSHVGDEYVGLADFGRNLAGPMAADGLSTRPAVKRTTLSCEVIQQLIAVEGAPGRLGGGTLRAYAGGEIRVGISGLQPHGLQSPSAQFGLEWRSDGNRSDVGTSAFASLVNGWLGQDLLATAWFGAFDLRLARPFNFARSDNPDGDTEVWTPSLWTPSFYGREYGGYAGSWHGMIGVSLFNPASRNASRGGRLAGNETLLTLDWYRGYSPHGPFLDSRRREHPRWYVVPSLTMHF